MFRHWLEDCGEVKSTYSNVEDASFSEKGLRSDYTGGRRRPKKSKINPEKMFKGKRHLKK